MLKPFENREQVAQRETPALAIARLRQAIEDLKTQARRYCPEHGIHCAGDRCCCADRHRPEFAPKDEYRDGMTERSHGPLMIELGAKMNAVPKGDVASPLTLAETRKLFGVIADLSSRLTGPKEPSEELVRLREQIVGMRSVDGVTADDAPGFVDTLCPAAAWVEGYTAGQNSVFGAAEASREPSPAPNQGDAPE